MYIVVVCHVPMPIIIYRLAIATILFFIDYDMIGNNMMQTDPHSLRPSVIEDVMQLELLASDKEHIVEFSEPDRYLPEQPVTSVQGRLRKSSKFWTDELEASPFVIDMITSGYRLPFLALPPAVCAKNHRSVFVEETIQELVESGCAVKVPTFPVVFSPLQVVVNAKGKRRLVIDLRYVSQYLHLTKFKYEGLNLIPMLFSKGDYVFTFDLKSGYHHVDIHRDSQTYLGFSWGEGADRRFYNMFRVLPFGLASACMLCVY
jgi:hypothetical protein